MTKTVIDRRQAQIFTIVVILIIVLCGFVVWSAGKPGIKAKDIEEMVAPLCVAAIGTASGIIVFWFLLAHDNEWWGNAQKALTSILLGALFGTALSVIQILKALAPLMP